MASALPVPTGPQIDPRTGAMSEEWRRYYQALEDAISGETAPSDAQYYVATASPELTNERNLGALASGFLKVTVAAGVATPSTVSSITTADFTGQLALSKGGTAADLSVSGGASQVLKQTTAGGAVTVGVLSTSDLSNGSNVALLSGTNAFTGANTFEAGGGTTTYAPGGRLHAITSTVTTTGTTEEVLSTYTMPANTLDSNGRMLHMLVGATTANNANSKTLRIRVGGIAGTMIASQLVSSPASRMFFDVYVVRRTSTTGFASETQNTINQTSITTDFTGSIDIVLTGQTSGAAGDVTVQQFAVVYLG